jgi:flagellar hook-associated protein 3 FlgL
MRTNALSTLSFWSAPRTGVARMQADIARGNEELVTGRFADVGLVLGSRAGITVGLRQKSAELAALRDGNAGTALRLSTSQAALKQMQESADTALKTLTGLPEDKRAGALKAMAANQLAGLTGLLNTSVDGQFVFGGTNTGRAPITAYTASPAAPAKAAVDAAFLKAFGVTQESAGAGTITADALSAFLDGPFQDLFDDASWAADWSGAGTAPLTSQISLTETVQSSASANAPAFRKLAMAYVMASDLGASNLSAAAQAVLGDRVAKGLSEASGGLVALQADLGRSQAAITAANTRLDAQKSLFANQIGQMEGVDTAEAKTRVDRLSTQVQISYALTAQLRQLSLVAYI